MKSPLSSRNPGGIRDRRDRMFQKIKAEDLSGKGVIGLSDTPELSTAEMQEKFEETSRQRRHPGAERFDRCACCSRCGGADRSGSGRPERENRAGPDRGAFSLYQRAGKVRGHQGHPGKLRQSAGSERRWGELRGHRVFGASDRGAGRQRDAPGEGG